MVKTNRDQRRKLKRAHIDRQPETLREYLDKPDLIVRRGEIWVLMGARIRVDRLDRLNNRPWRRVMRWMHGLLGPREPTVDPETGEENLDNA